MVFFFYALFQRRSDSGFVYIAPSVVNGKQSVASSVSAKSSGAIPKTFTASVSATQAAAASAPAPIASVMSQPYRDGVYTGSVADAYYGNVQVAVAIQNGNISDVQFLDYPQDRRTSVSINSQAMPYLRDEAIQAQSAQVDIISGATQTSMAFRESLAYALAQAKN